MARSGSCSPWILASDVSNNVMVQAALDEVNAKTTVITADQLNVICANAANAATEILYSLSGRQFTGNCGPVTVRPLQRPVDANDRGWGNVAGGWSYGSWGTGSGELGIPGVVKHYGNEFPPVVVLKDYPVNAILQVKINGTVIPSNEYDLRNQRNLVRVRPTAADVPTECWGWPTTQTMDLDDTELGTFSITYTFGQDPGYGGRQACVALAAFLALPQLGDNTQYPQRVTTINRQGITTQIASPIDIINKGATGIEEVDLWILSVNPNKLRKQSVFLSPDRARGNRQGTPSPLI